MFCPHCQNNDPSMFEVDSGPGTVILIIFCKVCSKTFWSVVPPKKEL